MWNNSFIGNIGLMTNTQTLENEALSLYLSLQIAARTSSLTKQTKNKKQKDNIENREDNIFSCKTLPLRRQRREMLIFRNRDENS